MLCSGSKLAHDRWSFAWGSSLPGASLPTDYFSTQPNNGHGIAVLLAADAGSTWRFLSCGWPPPALSLLAPVANNDHVSAATPTGLLDSFIAIDVLKNDSAPGSTISPASIAITAAPTHGQISFADRLHGGNLSYESWAYYDDENSPLGDGHASGLWGIVDPYGHLRLKITQYGDFGFNGDRNEVFFPPINRGGLGVYVTGDYALFIRLGVSDFSNFDPHDFDFQFGDRLQPGKVDSYDIPGLSAGTPFIAWIDNTVGSGTPDTMMIHVGPELLYSPDPEFIGVDTFRYTVKDENGLVSNEATVRVRVLRPPVEVRDASIQAIENTPVQVVHFYDNGGYIAHQITLTSPPAHGTAEILYLEGEVQLHYTPNPGYLGDDALRYTVKYAQSATSNEAAVDIHVIPVAPVAANDVAFAALNQPVSIPVLANDFDFDDGTLNPSSLAIASAPSHGTAIVRQTARGPRIVYRPNLNFLGGDEFSYTVRDNDGHLSNVALVTINPPPLVGDDFASAAENTPVAIDVFANDSQPYPQAALDPFSFAIVAAPARGSIELRQTSAGPVAVYTPRRGSPAKLVVDEPGDADDGVYSPGRLTLREAVKLANADGEPDAFAYTVQDNHGIVSNTAVVTVAVAANPTLITFAASFLAQGRRTIHLSHVGDVSEGNSRPWQSPAPSPSWVPRAVGASRWQGRAARAIYGCCWWELVAS